MAVNIERLLHDYLQNIEKGEHRTLMYDTGFSAKEILGCMSDLTLDLDIGNNSVSWFFVCLAVIKPEWLHNYKDKQAQKRIIRNLAKNKELLNKVDKFFVAGWLHLPMTTVTLWWLLATMVTFQKIGHTESPLFDLLDRDTAPYVNVYGPLLKGATWLIDELQIDEDDTSDLYIFLNKLSTLSNRSLVDFANMKIED